MEVAEVAWAAAVIWVAVLAVLIWVAAVAWVVEVAWAAEAAWAVVCLVEAIVASEWAAVVAWAAAEGWAAAWAASVATCPVGATWAADAGALGALPVLRRGPICLDAFASNAENQVAPVAVKAWAVAVVVAAVVVEVVVAVVVAVWAVAVVLEDAVAVAVWAVEVVVAVVATRAVARVSVATRARANQCSALESLVMTGIRGEMITTTLGETIHGAIHLVAVSARGLRCMVAVKVHHLHRPEEKTDGGKVLLRSSLHLPDLEVPRRSCHSMGAQVLRRFSLRSWALAT